MRGGRATVVVAIAVIAVALVGVLLHQPAAPSSSASSTSLASAPPPRQAPAAPPIRAGRGDGDGDGAVGDGSGGEAAGAGASGGGSDGAAGGDVPDGTTVFDGDPPAVGRLDPDLLAALRRAAADAAGSGVDFLVTSGWRSPAHQERLLREAIAQYGSAAEAARWVATPETSAHVSGDAIDLGAAAAAWLSAHGAAYGLCQIYGNEPWHYELRPDAVGGACPPLYADPTQDPRLR